MPDPRSHARELQTQDHDRPNVLTLDEVESIRAALGEIFEREKEIGDAGTGTRTCTAGVHAPQKHRFFREIPLNPRVLR